MKKYFLLAIIVSLGMVSCSSDDDGGSGQTAEDTVFTGQDFADSSEMDDVMQHISDVVEQALVDDENESTMARQELSANTGFSDCTVKSSVINGDNKTITLDFGNGCKFRNRDVSGKVAITFESDWNLDTRNVTVTFDGYVEGGREVKGTYDITRIRENQKGFRESKVDFDVTITYSFGSKIHRSGTRITELVEGESTVDWSDDVYEITTLSSWTTTGQFNNVMLGRVTKNVKIYSEYLVPVSGNVELKKQVNNQLREVNLDYGDGDFDNIVEITLESGRKVNFTIGS